MTSEQSVRPLESEISDGRRDISSEAYSMSIGELTNLFRDGELIIRPAFQRLYRWDNLQKSRLIESVLLGIPLPSIFVAQDEEGKWELIDGLQRVSTLLQLQGLLPNHPPLVLQATRYLSSLEGTSWDGDGDSRALSQALQLDIRRAKIDVKIIKRESSRQARYDLFQRLNSFGSQATAQEVRSALLVSVNPEFQRWIEEAAKSERFAGTTALSDREIAEQFDLELVVRFLVLHDREDVSRSALRGRGEFIDDQALRLAESFEVLQSNLSSTFVTTFDLMAAAGPEVFRKWDVARERFSGGFLSTAFEVIAMGVGFHVARGTPHRTDILAAAKELWSREDMTSGFATGQATEIRLARMLPLGRALMAE
ncbi:MAG: DUF262 domain-containing protein [Dehalococcoidia bacterium]